MGIKQAADQPSSEEHSSDMVHEIIQVNDGRAGFYRMLASLYFTELNAEQIEHIAAQDFSDMTGGDELIAEGYADIARYLSKRNASTREQLAVDYAHTFLAAGNYETFAATPYESVFTSEMGLLMQEARDEVYKMYCSEHIQPDESLHVPEDHISFEFQFLATLLERMNDALVRGDLLEARRYARLSQEFHEVHQLNWVDDLCDAIMDCAETRFYKGVSKITRGFVHTEAELMADVIEVLDEISLGTGTELAQ